MWVTQPSAHFPGSGQRRAQHCRCLERAGRCWHHLILCEVQACQLSKQMGRWGQVRLGCQGGYLEKVTLKQSYVEVAAPSQTASVCGWLLPRKMEKAESAPRRALSRLGT